MEAEPHLWSDFEAYLLSLGMTAYTARRYVGHSAYFCAWVQASLGLTADHIHQVTYSQLIDYLAHCKEQGNGTRSLQLKAQMLRHFFAYLMRVGQSEVNPAQHLKVRNPSLKRLYPVLSKAQLCGLYDHYGTDQSQPGGGVRQAAAHRRKLTVGLMVWQGLEVTALSGLSTGDVDLARGRLYVKGGRKYASRTLKLESSQVLPLYRYLEEIRPQLVRHYAGVSLLKSHPDVLLVHGGQSYHQVHRVLMRHLIALEPALLATPGAALRQLRSSVITHWLNSGYNLREVQYMAGYRYVCSVESLLRSDLERLQADVDRFFPLQQEQEEQPGSGDPSQ